jgi:hypothetical protein
MSDPDSIVEYVRSLDRRYNRLRDAVLSHRADKTERALPGSIDDFDRELWSVLDRAFPADE